MWLDNASQEAVNLFWQRCGETENFPRTLERSIALALPLCLVKLARLKLNVIESWLARRRAPFQFNCQSRAVRGCLVAFGGQGLVFVDGADQVDEQRFTIAHTVTVLLPAENLGLTASQSLVRIKSRSKSKGGDGRQYIGAVIEGPFAEPDGLRADAPIVVTTTVRGAQFMPRYHGRVQVEILAEEVDGTAEPPRFRPLPNSPVFVLDETETGSALGLGGDIVLGRAVGFENLRVAFDSRRKAVLPRHVGVLGTTGGGKSTTVSALIHQFQKAGIATVVIDTEGEYTEIGYPTDDKNMQRLLGRQARNPEGVSNVHVYHLIGRGTTASSPTPVSRV